MPKEKVLGTGPGLHITDLLKRGSQRTPPFSKLKVLFPSFKSARIDKISYSFLLKPHSFYNSCKLLAKKIIQLLKI